ncbi:MAG: S8 family serine peptidase [Planctomycetota bacterium]|nr:S8 family serine peptidase [Planctomycetota bacterium]
MLISLSLAIPLFAQHLEKYEEPKFVEIVGITEFTGRMIAKPNSQISPDIWENTGATKLRFIEETNEYIVEIPPETNENSFAATLMETGNFEYVHPDWMCYPVGDPDDPEFPNQWHHGVMQSSLAWDLIQGAPNQIISWVDTGVDHTHPDLAANLIPGYNSVDKRKEINGGDTSDVNGHGTHVAGCLGAIGNNAEGVAGVTWNMQLMPVRCSNSSGGGAYLSHILDGARWAADNGAKTVGASYSGVDNSSVGTTGTYLKSQDSLFFYAAGNGRQNWSSFDYPDTVVVGASGITDIICNFSGRGRGLDLVAPGLRILAPVVGGGYEYWSGTSMATPVANGVAAMIFAANPWLSADEVQTRLYQSCDDLGDVGEDDTYGMGRVNLRNAVEAALVGSIVLESTDLVAGQSSTISIKSAPANATVYLGYSTMGLDALQLPTFQTACALKNPLLLTTVTVNNQGTGSYIAQVPPNTSGRRLWVQAITMGTSSNFIELIIQ